MYALLPNPRQPIARSGFIVLAGLLLAALLLGMPETSRAAHASSAAPKVGAMAMASMPLHRVACLHAEAAHTSGKGGNQLHLHDDPTGHSDHGHTSSEMSCCAPAVGIVGANQTTTPIIEQRSEPQQRAQPILSGARQDIYRPPRRGHI